jgi:hypothetical protein
MSLRSRIARLEREWRCACGSGVYLVGAILLRYPGEPEPPTPDDLPVCLRLLAVPALAQPAGDDLTYWVSRSTARAAM